MYRSRTVLAQANFPGAIGNYRLLPPPTVMETAAASIQGMIAHFTDQDARDAYEEAVKRNLIKDSVLAQATNGSAITYALFHNLQNPLFKEYKFDAKEFVTAVGPALENFHDTVGRLGNDMKEAEVKKSGHGHSESEVNILASIYKVPEKQDEESSEEPPSLVPNEWKETAERDTDSLAAKLSRMVTNTCLDALFYAEKIDASTHALLSPGGQMMSYVPGSVSVGDVALLYARVGEINDDDIPSMGPRDLKDNDEYQGKKYPIAAQIDVLYEITTKFWKPASPGDASSTDTQPVVAKEKSGAKDDGTEVTEVLRKKEEESITHLAVAEFDGYLYGGPENKLRWRLAATRSAYEFPQ